MRRRAVTRLVVHVSWRSNAAGGARAGTGAVRLRRAARLVVDMRRRTAAFGAVGRASWVMWRRTVAGLVVHVQAARVLAPLRNCRRRLGEAGPGGKHQGKNTGGKNSIHHDAGLKDGPWQDDRGWIVLNTTAKALVSGAI